MIIYNMKKQEMTQLRLDGFTYAQIAERAGVSRQRIQQIIGPPKAVREYVANKHKGYCADCGLYVGYSGHVHHEGSMNGDDYNDRGHLILLCKSCHRRRHQFLSPSEKPKRLKITRDMVGTSTTTPQHPPRPKLRGLGIFQALRHYLGVNIPRSLKRG